MSFIADKQTLKDLDLLNRYSANSIFGIFNRVKSRGGEKLLDAYFANPLKDADAINSRANLFRFFQELTITFPFEKVQLEQLEMFFYDEVPPNLPAAIGQVAYLIVMQKMFRDDRFLQLQNGAALTLKFLNELEVFLRLFEDKGDTPYNTRLDTLKEIMESGELTDLRTHSEKLSAFQLARFNYYVKNVLNDKFHNVLALIYELDLLVAVSSVSRENNYSYALATPENPPLLSMQRATHPALYDGVANDIQIDQTQNMLFLTGANMAGKSTLMKMIGINVYLAHMGFPVAAKCMNFSVRDGLFCSINVPDDISKGQSHFYAEVLRVKHIAQAVASGQNLLVIFDELFKGTNVKDAYDATLAVSKAFAQYENCAYIISTHITEVTGELQRQCQSVKFSFLPTVMEGCVPRYTYKLEEGVTKDRQGMIMIENERILEIINGE